MWTVPARRVKANRQHRVPLCGRALEILEAAQALEAGTGPLVFTHGGGRPLHDSQVRRLLRQFGIAAVPHGFRSSFRDWAAEETDHPREVIRRPWRMWSGTGSRQPMPAPTCSTAGVS